jgi:hypothetical protein
MDRHVDSNERLHVRPLTAQVDEGAVQRGCT